LFLYPSQLNEEEDRENVAASPEGSTSDEDSSDSGEEGSSSNSRAAVMRAATTAKLLGAMKVLRRWTSWIRCFIRTMHTLKAVCIFVHSLSFSEQLFCKLLTCAGPASWAYTGRDAIANSSG
jgi:hypothetical protein